MKLLRCLAPLLLAVFLPGLPAQTLENIQQPQGTVNTDNGVPRFNGTTNQVQPAAVTISDPAGSVVTVATTGANALALAGGNGQVQIPTGQQLLVTGTGTLEATALKSATTSVNVGAAAAPTAGQVLTATAGNAATWQTPLSGATLNGITAATGNQAGIANGDFNIRWNWAKTTNSTTAFEFGESAASTGGTSTGGVPNQVIGKFSTLAGSTASPWSVYSRGSHVISAAPDQTQLYAANGTAANPLYSFAATTNTGIYSAGVSRINIATAGVERIRITSVGTGISSLSSGFVDPAAVLDLFSTSPTNTDATMSLRNNSADTLPALMVSRKSRGTASAPSAITTGDDLLRIGVMGYAGPTGGYVEAASITWDSTGAITDSATGIGGIINFGVREVGGSVTTTAAVTPAGLANPGGSKRVTAQFDKTNDTLADITGLSVPLRAGNLYRFRAVLFTTSDVAAGVKAAVAFSGAVTNIIYEGFTVNAGATTQSRATASGTAVGAVTAVTAATITLEGSVAPSAAGNLTVQFAQNATNAAASSVLVGSYLEVFGF